MEKKIVIHWFRNDLRLSDNPALHTAASLGEVLPMYILDDENAGDDALGAASRVWLHHSLNALNDALKRSLVVFKGNPMDILASLLERYDITDMCWNISYEPWCQRRDQHIIEWLNDRGINVHVYNGSLLWNPASIKKDDGTPYKVFTPFYRRGCLAADPPKTPLPSVKPYIACVPCPFSQGIEDLDLLPTLRWDQQMMTHWPVGEAAAKRQCDAFLASGLQNYKEGRNLPSKPFVSRLSPYIRFGEISVRYIWHQIQQLPQDKHADHFCSELGWREFSHYLLIHHPELARKNIQPKFDAFPWSDSHDQLVAWQRGQTGIPMVDAGMRELWQTGYMHNRTRMIVGSFLVKNLMIDWRHGERWFWDCLFDADPANNSASWQWVAGCGADAAPYFRIFNPVMQGKKFDPNGDYIRQYVPELTHMPLTYLFSPWEAPQSVLDAAQVRLGETYPMPIVDLKQSRQDALDAFSSLKRYDGEN